jgi:Phage terminase-like protein, large subunit
MCELDGAPLAELVTVEATRLTNKADPYSFIQRLTSKGRTKHGLNIHGVILDELHAWLAGEGDELWAALNTGSAARRQPMQIAITTAGLDLEESRCGQMYLLGRAIERGEQEDGGFFSAGGRHRKTWTTATPTTPSSLRLVTAIRSMRGSMPVNSLPCLRASSGGSTATNGWTTALRPG